MADRLDADALNRDLAGTAFAGKIAVFPTIDSTNTYAMEQAQTGAPHGSVYVAEEQTAGRGRGAHAWHSEAGAGLYISILLRPQIAPADALWMSLVTGLAVQHAIQETTALAADIRWPNDLLIGDRKFGGVLIEMNAEATRIHYAVAGVGINVNHRNFPPELKDQATSLALELGRDVSRQDLLLAILRSMYAELEPLMQPDTVAEAIRGIPDRLEQHSSWVRGKSVFVDEGGGYTGVTAGLDSRGFLRVQTGAGMRTALSGGVRQAKG